MGNVGWQSPSHQGIASPANAESYVYPEPQYTAAHAAHAAQATMYYQNSQAMRRPQSAEPEHYDPRQQNHIWPQTVQ